jgi:hypothetical protein
MNMPLRKALPIAATIAGLMCAPFAQTAMATTAFNTSYGPVPVTSTGVVAAARFAATAKSVQVKKILKAQQAATSNLHFVICMRVAEDSHAYLVETKVSRAAGKPYSLDAWTKVKTCK